MHVEEFAPHMRPTASVGNPVASELLVEAGIAVSVNDAGEFLQMGARMLAFAIRRVAEQCGRRLRAAEAKPDKLRRSKRTVTWEHSGGYLWKQEAQLSNVGFVSSLPFVAVHAEGAKNSGSKQTASGGISGASSDHGAAFATPAFLT
jgi:hypothetical protein